jgi:hypothetical protein
MPIVCTTLLVARTYKLYVCYLTLLSVSKLFSVNDRIIDEYEAVGEMKIGSRHEVLG